MAGPAMRPDLATCDEQGEQEPREISTLDSKQRVGVNSLGETRVWPQCRIALTTTRIALADSAA